MGDIVVMRPPATCSRGIDAPLSRRSVLAGSVGIAGIVAATPLYSAEPSTTEDERFMRMAIEEARRADFPFGAVIVRGGRVLARGRNLGRSEGDPTAHGAMVAIRRCLAAPGKDALKGATLYTSGEPCAMCMGAILWCHIGRLVFAASVQQLASKIHQIMLSSADVAATARFAPISLPGGVLADMALTLFDKR